MIDTKGVVGRDSLWSEMSLLTKKQIIISQIIIAAAAFILGVLFLLSALNVLPLNLLQAVLILIPAVGGAALLVLGFVQDNTLLIWISIILLIAFIVSFINFFGCCDLTFRRLYPFYIVSPAVASLFVGIYENFKLKPRLKIILPFTALAIAFALNSFFGLHFLIVFACIALFVCIAFILFIIKTTKGKNKPNDK